ncbi:molybdate ABC transporter substrate-binding protein [Allonocardiopsis opalescens]|uniref:Molybdate transport system substrate-binding protein n=1 Tax=Allonocardiopsis opalescens TaxID=1144618 RepID=A0A2T0QCK3_9ACTN|nr:molybdate ABC transporter substrate-binding protein [Allonocardiopsis opalescens]PRY01635.1 molybdate transport system substrate-binding protein [Allonocardiopsis opalescens]
MGTAEAGRRTLAVAAGLLAAALLGAACAPVQEGAGGSAATGEDTAAVTVFAAASLTDVFERLGTRFEERHPGTEVRFNFAGSSELVQQLTEGAPADVFAAASTATMDQAVEAGAVADEPEVFARNTLEIAVPAGNPGGVGSLADLADPALQVVLCAEQVPCGAATRTVLAETGVEITPVDWADDVRAALTRVRLDEADAAIVYRTDVLSAEGEVEGVPFEEASTAVNDYPIAALTEAPEPDLAAAFIELVRSETGTEALAGAGFQVP